MSVLEVGVDGETRHGSQDPVGDPNLVLHVRLCLEETEPLVVRQPYQVPLLLVLGRLGAGHLSPQQHSAGYVGRDKHDGKSMFWNADLAAVILA